MLVLFLFILEYTCMEKFGLAVAYCVIRISFRNICSNNRFFKKQTNKQTNFFFLLLLLPSFQSSFITLLAFSLLHTPNNDIIDRLFASVIHLNKSIRV